MQKKWGLWTTMMLITMAAFIIGCSDESPLSSNGYAPVWQAAGDPVQFSAQVKTVNQSQRMLTFEGRPDTTVAAHNCLIVRFKNEMETPIPFVDVGPGDAVNVFGQRQQNGMVIANKIQVYQQTCDGYDLAFRDTIATIDYASGSFTVNNHTQMILIDENTYIWGITTQNKMSNQYNVELRAHSSTSLGDPGLGTGESHNMTVVLDFTDLAVGDIVEVKANIVNEETLLAVKIKLAAASRTECNIINAYIATIDYETRLVTFDGYGWIGYVCPKARLTGLDGEVLTLEDFAVGDYVAVKGYNTGDANVLNICKMEKIEP
jgi:hypothetical protein